jgi:hypothetical protein
MKHVTFIVHALVDDEVDEGYLADVLELGIEASPNDADINVLEVEATNEREVEEE